MVQRASFFSRKFSALEDDILRSATSAVTSVISDQLKSCTGALNIQNVLPQASRDRRMCVSEIEILWSVTRPSHQHGITTDTSMVIKVAFVIFLIAFLIVLHVTLTYHAADGKLEGI